MPAQAEAESLSLTDEDHTWEDDNGDILRADGKMLVLIPAIDPLGTWIDYIPRDDPNRDAKIRAAVVREAAAKEYAKSKAATGQRNARSRERARSGVESFEK